MPIFGGIAEAYFEWNERTGDCTGETFAEGE